MHYNSFVVSLCYNEFDFKSVIYGAKIFAYIRNQLFFNSTFFTLKTDNSFVIFIYL